EFGGLRGVPRRGFLPGMSDQWDQQAPSVNLRAPDDLDVEAPPQSTDLVPVPQPESEDAAVRRGDVDAWGRSDRMREVARMVYDPLYSHWFRVEWEGLEHIPRQGGALIVANHAAAIPSDAPVIMHGIEKELHRPVYGLAENLLRAIPMLGTLWSRF